MSTVGQVVPFGERLWFVSTSVFGFPFVSSWWGLLVERETTRTTAVFESCSFETDPSALFARHGAESFTWFAGHRGDYGREQVERSDFWTRGW